MARIAGVNLPAQKHAVIGFTAIYVIGRTRSSATCAATGVSHTPKIRVLTTAEQEALSVEVAQFSVVGDLPRDNTR